MWGIADRVRNEWSGRSTNQGQFALLVEKDRNLATLIEEYLEQWGHHVIVVDNCQRAMEESISHDVSVGIFNTDDMNSDNSGYDLSHLCSQLKARNRHFVEVFIGERNLTNGCSPHLKKPFRMKSLSTVMHRQSSDDRSLPAGGMMINPSSRLFVDSNKSTINLTRKEFDLLFLFASNPGTVLCRNEILDRVWGERAVVGPRTVDNFVCNLNKKLCRANTCDGAPKKPPIVTVRGVGYRLDITINISS